MYVLEKVTMFAGQIAYTSLLLTKILLSESPLSRCIESAEKKEISVVFSSITCGLLSRILTAINWRRFKRNLRVAFYLPRLRLEALWTG